MAMRRRDPNVHPANHQARRRRGSVRRRSLARMSAVIAALALASGASAAANARSRPSPTVAFVGSPRPTAVQGTGCTPNEPGYFGQVRLSVSTFFQGHGQTSARTSLGSGSVTAAGDGTWQYT